MNECLLHTQNRIQWDIHSFEKKESVEEKMKYIAFAHCNNWTMYGVNKNNYR